jgi:hypothetical protein
MRTTLVVTLVGGGLVAVIVALTALYILKGICSLLRDMTNSLRALANGDLAS